MRRAPVVLAATVAGTAGVLAFHPHAPATTVAATAAPTATVKRTSAAGAVSGTATGAVVDTQYGPTQVAVRVRNGRITAVRALQSTNRDSRSVQISSAAEPVLEQEVLSAQSAAVDTVSGATFTSGAYEQSLQSALDKLGFRPGASATAGA